MSDDRVDLSSVVTVSVEEGPCSLLSSVDFIVMLLRIGYGPRSSDARHAFTMLGGRGYSFRRKARRERLIRIAEEIAEIVGHGDEPEPMTIYPNFMCVNIKTAEEARRMFGSEGG